MAENNIIIKITSEADLDSAQKALQDLTKRAEEQEQAMQQLRREEQEDAKSIKQLGLSEKELADALQKNKKHYQDLRTQKKAETAETKKSIKELQNQVKAYNTLNGASGKAVQQLRAMRERLMEMEDAGEFGSQAFIDLSIAAGKLEDQIGDTQQRIRVLASDTKEIDAVMGLGDGLAGSFYVATSAAELLGGDMEGLQQAFYKVQNAMSVVSGVQQVWNTLNKDSAAMVVLNTALNKLFAKSKQKNAVASATDATASAADAAAKGAQAVATGTATKAQWSLNAAMAANPIGVIIALILAAVAAVAALGIGIYKLVHYFSAAGEAEREYAKASKELEKIQAENAVGAAKRAYDRQKQVKETSDAEEEALAEAKKRNASEIELAQIKANYAKQAADDTKKYTEDEIKRNQKETDQYKIMMEAKRKEMETYRVGSKKHKKALEALAEAEQNYYDSLQKTTDLQNEANEADKAAKDAEQELLEARKQARLQAEQANIDLMREGAAKEIAQINYNYREQLKSIKGNSAEEIALRKALLAKQAKEIAKVRRQYALQAQQTAIQEQKNLLTAMSQSRGTEADYAEEIALTKKIAEQEAQARIDALDKENMAAEDYAAQVKAIELDLANTKRDIDEQEVNRLAENKRRETEIVLAEAEAQKNALTGAESQEEQLAALDQYYAARKKQLEENAELEKQAVKRSTATQEEKDAQILLIDKKLQADLTDLTKEGEQERINVYSQGLTQLEIEADKAARAVEKAQGGDKLTALKANLDAQTALYKAQQDQLDAQWNAGLISWQDYQQQKWEITKATIDAETQYQQDAMQTIADGFETALGYMQQVSDLAFEAINQNIQAELDALDEEYTTDWEEAQKNADKKYLTEEEYEKKKAALELKAAKYAKAQALINAGIAAALAIVQSLAQSPVAYGPLPNPAGIASLALATAMGAAQIAVIAAKPLAQYAKGRKGGKGEYALVGEKGAELMYVPQGASIVPHDKIGNQAAWADYGVPKLSIPPLPSTDLEMTKYIATTTDNRLTIDYDRLGEAVAKYIPQQKAVTVNVDRSGVHVNDGFGSHTYLNRKYAGSWN